MELKAFPPDHEMDASAYPLRAWPVGPVATPPPRPAPATEVPLPTHIAAPTPAPTATPGPAPTLLVQALPTLPGGPLLTPEQVLGQVLQIDRQMATWELPWSVDTLKSDPSRITIEWFPTRSAESGQAGTYAQELDAAAGPVWRVSIRGRVHVELLSPNVADRNRMDDGVTYVIAQNSGALLSVATE